MSAQVRSSIIIRLAWAFGIITAIASIAALFTTMPGGWSIGYLEEYVHQGLLGSKLVPSVAVLSVFFLGMYVVSRGTLEDIGLEKKQEEWQDWRDEPMPPPVQRPDEDPKPRKRPCRLSLEAEPWTHRGGIRRLRGSRARTHWGYNNE